MADLSIYAGKEIAVLFEFDGVVHVVKGTAVYEEDDLLGWVLRIVVPEGETPSADVPSEVLIAETEWQGKVTSGDAYGCDFCFHPASADEPGD